LRKTCSEISVRQFIKAYCEGDLTVLIIQGEPTGEQLKEAFEEIIYDYSVQIKSDDDGYLFHLCKKIALHRWHISFVDYALSLLRIKFVKEVADELMKLGYYVDGNREDEDRYQQQLNRITSLCKTQIHDLADLEEQYSRIEKTTGNKPMTRDEMMKSVATLSKYQGYRIDCDSTTLEEYINIFNNYTQELSASRIK
jgi:hypothetical protein